MIIHGFVYFIIIVILVIERLAHTIVFYLDNTSTNKIISSTTGPTFGVVISNKNLIDDTS